jgi:hypothetical protein
MTLRSGSLAAVSVACAVAAAILLAAVVIERVKPTPEPVALVIDPGTPPEATAPPAPAPAPAATPPPDVELLHATSSVVAVSSLVQNAKIRPEHLVDGDLETAWNSRTGDLRPWIRFRVPKAARVHEVRLTVGFTHSDKGDDWFVMNHRIRAVELSRDGAALGRFLLDPDNRALQRIPLDQPGGDFTLAIVDAVPGTRAGWREIAISELEVWGALPAGTAPAHAGPQVRVGDLDDAPALAMLAGADGPFRDEHAYCEQFNAQQARAGADAAKAHADAKAERKRLGEPELEEMGDDFSHGDGDCSTSGFRDGPESLDAARSAPIRAARVFSTKDDWWTSRVCHMLVETATGWYMPWSRACGSNFTDFGFEFPMYIDELALHGSTLIFRYRMALEEPEAEVQELVVCQRSASLVVVCTEPIAIARWSAPGIRGEARHGDPPVPRHLEWRLNATLSTDQHQLVVSPADPDFPIKATAAVLGTHALQAD